MNLNERIDRGIEFWKDDYDENKPYPVTDRMIMNMLEAMREPECMNADNKRKHTWETEREGRGKVKCSKCGIDYTEFIASLACKHTYQLCDPFNVCTKCGKTPSEQSEKKKSFITDGKHTWIKTGDGTVYQVIKTPYKEIPICPIQYTNCDGKK